MHSKIESTSNPKVKHLVRLRKSSRYRRETGKFILEGKREIEAMLASGRRLEEIFYSEGVSDEINISSMVANLADDLQIFKLSNDSMIKVSYRSCASEIIAVANTWNLGMMPTKDMGWKLVLVLDEIEKPGNLGAILRTAEAMGVDAVLLADSCVDFFNPNVIRSSMGLFANMPIFTGNKEQVFEFIKKSNLTMVGTSSKSPKSIYEHVFESRIALIMGSESKGLGTFWEKHSDSMISIPILGKASSLNLNCATAGILMEINRRKRTSKVS